MKATELMIGDWVFGTRIKANVKVVAIDSERQLQDIIGSVRVLSDDNSFGTWAQYLEPIPLTAEILEKNGFVRPDKHEYSVTGSNYNYLKVRCYADTYFEIGNAFDEEGELQAFADIQYVHDLQHALKLCGIDKNIEL